MAEGGRLISLQNTKYPAVWQSLVLLLKEMSVKKFMFNRKELPSMNFLCFELYISIFRNFLEEFGNWRTQIF